MTGISKEQCIEFAKLEKLYLHHWTLLTGVSAGKDDSFAYGHKGIFPVQYTEHELAGLTPGEQFELGEISNQAPLLFPCTPTQLIQFIDHVPLGDFSVPEDFREAVKEKADAEFTGTFAEVVSNGQAIDWRYWMSMKTLTASQSSRLMVGLDPDIFTSLDHNGPARDDTSGQRLRAKKIERLALNHGMAEGTASEWLSWAKSNGFSIHRLFAIEVEGRNVAGEVISSVAAVDQGAAPDKESSSGAPESAGLATILATVVPPGKMPNVTVGKLAIKAAWEIECKTNRTASREDVIALLQKWADAGDEPEFLFASDKKKRGVTWLTKGRAKKLYDVDACGKTLKNWMESRA